jgi:hypothetical protein
MKARGLIPEKAIYGWKCCYGQEFPTEDRTETVVLQSFYEKGFDLPTGAFFRRLLYYYWLEAMHLKPNSIICARAFWASLPTSTFGGPCITLGRTRRRGSPTWLVGPPSLSARGKVSGGRPQGQQQEVGGGVVPSCKPGSWDSTAVRPSASPQRQVGGKAFRGGDVLGGVRAGRAARAQGVEADRGRRCPVLLQAADPANLGEDPLGGLSDMGTRDCTRGILFLR